MPRAPRSVADAMECRQRARQRAPRRQRHGGARRRPRLPVRPRRTRWPGSAGRRRTACSLPRPSARRCRRCNRRRRCSAVRRRWRDAPATIRVLIPVRDALDTRSDTVFRRRAVAKEAAPQFRRGCCVFANGAHAMQNFACEPAASFITIRTSFHTPRAKAAPMNLFGPPPCSNAPLDDRRRRVAHAVRDPRRALGFPADGRRPALAAPDRKTFRRGQRRDVRKVAPLPFQSAVL